MWKQVICIDIEDLIRLLDSYNTKNPGGGGVALPKTVLGGMPTPPPSVYAPTEDNEVRIIFMSLYKFIEYILISLYPLKLFNSFNSIHLVIAIMYVSSLGVKINLM